MMIEEKLKSHFYFGLAELLRNSHARIFLKNRYLQLKSYLDFIKLKLVIIISLFFDILRNYCLKLVVCYHIINKIYLRTNQFFYLKLDIQFIFVVMIHSKNWWIFVVINKNFVIIIVNSCLF